MHVWVVFEQLLQVIGMLDIAPHVSADPSEVGEEFEHAPKADIRTIVGAILNIGLSTGSGTMSSFMINLMPSARKISTPQILCVTARSSLSLKVSATVRFAAVTACAISAMRP